MLVSVRQDTRMNSDEDLYAKFELVFEALQPLSRLPKEVAELKQEVRELRADIDDLKIVLYNIKYDIARLKQAPVQ
jgi:archaellum component FlaC